MRKSIKRFWQDTFGERTDTVQIASEDSFPASDAPGWITMSVKKPGKFRKVWQDWNNKGDNDKKAA